ncbi:invasion associated locus B family protein [Mesorhizobium sp. KR1-2]|uniref:invasion associated locus B family protein n=1 Tax=Mesorhizobium sp. KR1-2 TaxID=3156609 RepID=UPI0032B4D236
MTLNRGLRLAALLIAGAAFRTVPVLAQATPLPGGASSLQETYQDWRVACQIVNGAKLCAVSQQQVRPDGQRVLAVELQAAAGDTATGTLVLPFGLLLDAGVTLQIDDRQALAPLRFRTCLPAGCVVALSFDNNAVAALRAGATLNLKASAADTSQEVTLTVSLTGLAAALDRNIALERP